MIALYVWAVFVFVALGFLVWAYWTAQEGE